MALALSGSVPAPGLAAGAGVLLFEPSLPPLA